MYFSESVPLYSLFCKENTLMGLLFQETSFQSQYFVFFVPHLMKKKNHQTKYIIVLNDTFK